MIVVSEHYFVTPEHWTIFEEYCRGLSQNMASRRGCLHHCLVRGRQGASSHVLHSIWESVELFRAWTRSDSFVLAANAALTASFLAPRQAEVQVLSPLVTADECFGIASRGCAGSR